MLIGAVADGRLKADAPPRRMGHARIRTNTNARMLFVLDVSVSKKRTVFNGEFKNFIELDRKFEANRSTSFRVFMGPWFANIA